MIEAIAFVVIVLLAAVLIFAATRPDTFRVERSLRIKPPRMCHGPSMVPCLIGRDSWGLFVDMTRGSARTSNLDWPA